MNASEELVCLREGDDLRAERDGRLVYLLRVLYIEEEYIYLRRVCTENLYRLKRATRAVYSWTPTGWDSTDLAVRKDRDPDTYMGD